MQKNNGIILSKRDFIVAYRQKYDDVWYASAELLDDIHQIKTWLEIKIPDSVIKDADVEFLKKPLAECDAVNILAKKLVEAKIKDLRVKTYRTFLGAHGCSQLYLLFGLSGPRFINIYYLNLVNEGKMTKAEYDKLMRKDCLAHKLHSTKLGKIA